MTVLYLVPNAYLRKFRRMYSGQAGLQVMTMPGLVAQILKEGQLSYGEDSIVEEVAIWQSVQDHADGLVFFAPIAEYLGFIQELKWLFQQIGLGEAVFQHIPAEGQTELRSLYDRYQEILREHGILDAPGQLKKALELVKTRTFMEELKYIQLQGLGELRPLENEFLQTFAKERPLTVYWPDVEEANVAVIKASDPYGEVELIAAALREQIKQGVPLDKLAVAFPSPKQYLPIIVPVFKAYKIPWRAPTTTLRNTPLGKTLLSLFAGGLEGWHKQHLQLLTAPGWGFPFPLTAEDHRLLHLAPPLKGLPAWRNYLGQSAAWNGVISYLIEFEAELVPRPLREYGLWLDDILGQLEPERWSSPQENLEYWAELVKAWDGLENIAQSLKQYNFESNPEQFYQLLGTLCDSYQIQARRVLAEQVQVLSLDQLGAYTYERLFAGGLVEGQFPQHKLAHWLTKATANIEREELYLRLIHSALNVKLYYPEVDRQGKLNLPATILPPAEERSSNPLPRDSHHPSLFLGQGFLSDPELLAHLQQRILQEGLSVSQLNRYANCPFQFFCSYVLKLVPAEEVSLELDARMHGTIIHDVLHHFWEQHLERPLPTVEEAQNQIEGLTRREFLAKSSTPTKGVVRMMRDFIRNDLNASEGGFRPQFLEKWFQGLSINTSMGSVEIRGRIDRIDLYPDGAYVLYDYKTGTAPSINAMLGGNDIQIATYLLAAQKLLPQGKNVGVAYYLVGKGRRTGIFHKAYTAKLGLSGGSKALGEDEFTEHCQKFEAILAGLIDKMLQGKFPIEPMSSRICEFCPFQGICRKEVGR